MRKKYTKLNKGNHNVYKLNYHLVLVVKYRKQVIDDKISNRLKEIFENIGKNYGVMLIEWNHDIDHVHALIEATPSTSFKLFMNAYKSASSRLIKREFPNVTKQLWKSHFWSGAYCLITTGGAPLDLIKEYIKNQGEP